MLCQGYEYICAQFPYLFLNECCWDLAIIIAVIRGSYYHLLYAHNPLFSSDSNSVLIPEIPTFFRIDS